MNKTNLNKFFSYLTLVFPVSLITGPLIPEIILGLVAIGVNYQIIRSKKFFYYNSKFSIFFLIFWSYLFLNSLLAEDIIWSLKTSIFYFRYYIFSIAIFYLIENNFLKFNKLKVCLLATFFILILDLFIQYGTGQNILGFVASENRYSSFFGDELVLGSYMIKFFPLLLFSLVLDNSLKNNKFYILLIFLLLIISLFFIGERTAAILGVFSIFLFLMILIKDIKIIIKYSLLLLTIPILIISTNSKIKKRFVDDTLNYISSSRYENYVETQSKDTKKQSEEKIYIFSKLHHGHYVSAYNLFVEKPIFGNGVNSFRNKCKKYDHEFNCSTHPHNFFLQILSELGLVGSLFYIFFVYYLTKNILSSKIPEGIKILSVGLLIYLFPIAPSGNFFNNWLNMIFYYLIGFYIYLSYQNEVNRKDDYINI